MIEYCDVVLDLAEGDCSKGKITNEISKLGSYTHALRCSGGHNTGATIYVNDKKLVGHIIPIPVVNKIKSIIGPGCALNVKMFFEEKKQFEETLGFSLDGLLFIAENCHIITDEHLLEDSTESVIGSTKKGNMPCYRDKYGRKGVLAKDVEELKPYLIDMKKEFFDLTNREEHRILAILTQGFYLDPIWTNNYPYCTSSHCGIGGVIINGIPPQKIRNVYGAAKVYSTYVGNLKKQIEEPMWYNIQEVGKEYGATTGRKRQCYPINIDELITAINMNGVTTCVISKLDVLEEVKHFEAIWHGDNLKFDDSQAFQGFIQNKIRLNTESCKSVIFSRSPYTL